MTEAVTLTLPEALLQSTMLMLLLDGKGMIWKALDGLIKICPQAEQQQDIVHIAKTSWHATVRQKRDNGPGKERHCIGPSCCAAASNK